MRGIWSMLALVGLSACVEAPAELGRQIYLAYCTASHGGDGRGGGAIANELPVAPPDLTRLTAENGGVFPSSRVMAKIYGYPGDYPIQVMPEFGPLLEGPSVRWIDETGAPIETPRALIQLRDYLVSIQTD